MQLFHTYHRHGIYDLLHSEFRLFEFSIWLHVFSRSMIAIFIPIILLQLGYSIGEVMIYYLVYNIFDVPLNFFAGWLTRKIGARLVIILGSLASIAFFVGLYYLTAGNWPLLIAIALFAALYDVLYWVAHIYFFMKCTKQDTNLGKDTSSLRIVKKIAGILAPAIGAIILIFFNQKILIIVSVIVLALSIWPLLKIKGVKDKPEGKAKSAREFFDSWDKLKDYIFQSLSSLHGSAEGDMWPIFIFLLFESIESVAIIPIIVSITAIVFTYFTGKVKRASRNKMIMIGSLLIALTWIIRLSFTNAIILYASVFLIGFFAILVDIPLDSNIFEKGKQSDALSASMYRNTFSMFAKMLLFAVLALLVNVFHVSFIIAAAAMFVLMALSAVASRFPRSIDPKLAG